MEQEVNLSLDASTIIRACRGKGLNEVPKCQLVSDCSVPNMPTEQLNTKQLLPSIHRYFVRKKDDAFHPQLWETCQQYPIVLIHGLTEALEFNFDLFSTETVVNTSPNKSIEIRDQVRCGSNENRNVTQNEDWKCISAISYTTLRLYEKYQTKYLENQAEQEKNLTVKFATNIDLSTKKWKPQMQELEKLPSFLKVKSTDNMLNYVGYNLLGINTVQLYMKVPDCKTPGHQENNNFCSVNINIGPSDCEWFAVSYEYWGVIYSLCEQNGVDYMRDSWWPLDLDILSKNNIPFYRFHQKMGDVVWVNVGCVHWVQSKGCCNNIAWNVGPFTARQYQLALERYEWNKLRRFQSIVPMVYLSWNLAYCNKISDPQLFQLIKNCLMQTMKHHYLIREFVRHKGLKKLCHDGDKPDCTIYCVNCAAEVFNIIICKKKKRKNGHHSVYCIYCALEQSPSLEKFFCIEKFHFRNLKSIYNEFTCQ